MDNAIGAGGERLAVGCDQHSDSRATSLAQNVENGAFCYCVDLSGRFVSQEHAGSGRQSYSETRPRQFPRALRRSAMPTPDNRVSAHLLSTFPARASLT